MEFIEVHNFVSYIEANLIVGRLEEVGINSWLKDENTISVNPIWVTALGGIKLMVLESDVETAKEMLTQWENERKDKYACPNCGSHELEMIITPRKLSNWLTAISTFLLASYPVAPDQVYHCFTCKAEFNEPIENGI